MISPYVRYFVVALAPIAVGACAEPGPIMGQASPAAPLVGTDLGASSRIPRIAGLAGEGAGEMRDPPLPRAHGSRSVGGMPMDHASMGHGSMGQGQMDHASMGHGSAGDSMPAARRSSGPEKQMAHSGHGHARGSGTVNSVDAAARKINVTHDPIPAIGWPTMTMDFPVAPSVNLNAITPGGRINFQMEQGPDGMYLIQSITPAAAPAGARRQ